MPLSQCVFYVKHRKTKPFVGEEHKKIMKFTKIPQNAFIKDIINFKWTNTLILVVKCNIWFSKVSYYCNW